MKLQKVNRSAATRRASSRRGSSLTFGKMDFAAVIAEWPTKDRMVGLLREAGLSVTVGRYSIRVNDCEHFVFQEYGEDMVCPVIDADADSVALMARDAQRVSSALVSARVPHRFEVYDGEALAGTFQHDWPDE